jgi:hypothetical protein
MFTTIIIDRVGNTNVFNVIQNDVNKQVVSESKSLQSITDNDLIEEYLGELTQIASLAVSCYYTNRNTPGTRYFDLNKRLHQIGETLYRQFFPSYLHTFFSQAKDEYIHFHIDPALASIPLEILSDGKNFLWEKFYIGKSIKGLPAPQYDSAAKDSLSMLIIADPTENLEWARKEGEELFEHLNSNYPQRRLQLELIAGKHISKLSLLNDIVGKDIIHYSGHLYYTNDTQENGWLLYDNKIIHAREIQKSGAAPNLIFSNSCISARSPFQPGNADSWYENFASSFLKSEKTNYVGTIWELPDTEQTLKFTLNFYDNIFQGHPVGYSLYLARKFAKENFPSNDLSWASYLLMGSPVYKIFQKESRLPDLSRNILDSEMVLKKYPFPIALAYSNAVESLKIEKSQESNLQRFESLYELFENTILFAFSLVFSNYQYLNISKPFEFIPSDLKSTVNSLYRAIHIMDLLKMELMIPNLSEILVAHKDEILKIISWRKQYDEKKISPSSLEGYVISIQYLIERILLDLEYLKIYGLYRIGEPGYIHLSLNGLPAFHRMKEIILPTQTNEKILEEITIRTTSLIGKCVFYIPVKRVFLDLSGFLDIKISDNDSGLNYNVHFKEFPEIRPLPAIVKKKNLS